MVTVRPLSFGRAATLTEGFTVGLSPCPNQYSGRYIRYWKSNRLRLLMFWLFMYGKMYVAGLDGCSAQTATPPFSGLPFAGADGELLEQPAAARASATAPTASRRPPAF